MNKVVLVGRLTKDPELRYTDNGKSVCKFNLAVNRVSPGTNQADFISCVAWGTNAENLNKYMRKGSLILVEGNIKTGSYQDNNGNKHYTTDVWVEKVEYLSKGAETQQQPQYQQPPQAPSQFSKTESNDPFANLDNPYDVNQEDLPF